MRNPITSPIQWDIIIGINFLVLAYIKPETKPNIAVNIACIDGPCHKPNSIA